MVIFSTSPPYTSHIIASELQRETGLLWIADFRDLWTPNHYIRHTPLRRWLETKLERKTMKNAKALITVSKPLAEKLKRLHSKPVKVITNGFDEDDYADPSPPLTKYFSLTYTDNLGQTYQGKRDPSPLFAAIKAHLGSDFINPRLFHVRFYGPKSDRTEVLSLARHYGIQPCVSHGGCIPHHEAILRQRESTALLLINWNCPEEEGVYTGKIFEYLAARRPILAISSEKGVIGKLLQETRSGFVASTKEEIVKVLKSWYDEFVEKGTICYRGKGKAIMKHTRQAQTRKLVAVFNQLKNK